MTAQPFGDGKTDRRDKDCEENGHEETLREFEAGDYDYRARSSHQNARRMSFSTFGHHCVLAGTKPLPFR